MDVLIALGQEVEITVRPTHKEHGQVSIVLARSSRRGSRLEDVIIFVDLSKLDPGDRPLKIVLPDRPGSPTTRMHHIYGAS
jgi:hypothetical protein